MCLGEQVVGARGHGGGLGMGKRTGCNQPQLV